jgi:hypothetical protein
VGEVLMENGYRAEPDDVANNHIRREDWIRKKARCNRICTCAGQKDGKMNWRLEKACALGVVSFDIPKTTVVRVTLIEDALDRIGIGLSLLREELIDSFDLVDEKGTSRLRVRRSTRAVSIQLLQDNVDLALDSVALEMWQHFTLRALRDGTAEVDHIDIEAELSGGTHELVDLVIVYPSSAPPVSPDEVRRRLDR